MLLDTMSSMSEFLSFRRQPGKQSTYAGQVWHGLTWLLLHLAEVLKVGTDCLHVTTGWTHAAERS